MRPSALRRPVAIVVVALLGCDGAQGDQRALVVFNAGSLARPLRAAVDSFAAPLRVRVDQESAGSLETARKLTELGKVPDVIALADHEVFPLLLLPEHVSWYALFARNRMVVAYTDRSRHASEIDAGNWWRVLARTDVEVGRADPDLDPNGYRTLLVMQLAARHYGVPGLPERLLARAPDRNVRPKEADLVALLQAGELDYIWSYESLARSTGLRYVRLPDAIDLGSPADSARYAAATVRVRGRSERDSLVIRGAPIVYALSVPHGAPHPERAAAAAAFLLSPKGRRLLRASGLDALESPRIIGRGAPTAVSASAATPDTAAATS